jgi:hypothetical protein
MNADKHRWGKGTQAGRVTACAAERGSVSRSNGLHSSRLNSSHVSSGWPRCCGAEPRRARSDAPCHTFFNLCSSVVKNLSPRLVLGRSGQPMSNKVQHPEKQEGQGHGVAHAVQGGGFVGFLPRRAGLRLQRVAARGTLPRIQADLVGAGGAILQVGGRVHDILAVTKVEFISDSPAVLRAKRAGNHRIVNQEQDHGDNPSHHAEDDGIDNDRGTGCIRGNRFLVRMPATGATVGLRADGPRTGRAIGHAKGQCRSSGTWRRGGGVSGSRRLWWLGKAIGEIGLGGRRFVINIDIAPALRTPHPFAAFLHMGGITLGTSHGSFASCLQQSR